MNKVDKIVVVLYFIMVVACCVACVLVTQEFVGSHLDPESFLSYSNESMLTMPVITVCLSRPGIPHSRLQLFNFSDANGETYRGGDPLGRHKMRKGVRFNDAVERFWHNPRNENCDEKVGDFFPFPTDSLNAIANGSYSSECKPCYRVGRKMTVNVNSTEFVKSTFMSLYTDNHALECLQRPGGLSGKSRRSLRNRLSNQLRKNKTREDILNSAVLTRSDGKRVQDLSLTNISKLNGQQLCNILYFGLWPKILRSVPRGNNQIRYEFDGTNWTFKGTGPEFIPPRKKFRFNDFFPLQSIQVFISHNTSTMVNSTDSPHDMVLLGPNTQTYVGLMQLEFDEEDEIRYDVNAQTSNLVEKGMVPLFGFWFQYRLYVGFQRLITQRFYQESTYTPTQWLVDFTGYIGLFTGASIFSVLLLPVLMHMRQRERRTLRKENPEAYLLRKYRKHFRGERSDDGSNNGRAETGRNVMLPGYSV